MARGGRVHIIPGEIFLSDLCVPQTPSVATVDARYPNRGRPLPTEIFSHSLEKRRKKITNFEICQGMKI